MKFEDLAVFLQRFGFPVYDGGKDIVLGEFLIEAKKLHLAMKAWGSVTQQDWACARESLEELRFACHPDAHWYFWPAPICDLSGVAEAHELMTLKDRFMQLMEQERPNASWLVGSTEWETDVIRSWKVFGVSDHAAAEQVAQARQARLKALRPSEVLTECVRQIESLCVEPLKLVEITPELCAAKIKSSPKSMTYEKGLELRWNLRPVQFLGEEEREYATLAHEEPHFATPYLLMFLLDVANGGEIQVCADQSCKKPFEARRRNQRFCGYACAHRTASRDYRKRKATLPDR
jgi:hypothetical protein